MQENRTKQDENDIALRRKGKKKGIEEEEEYGRLDPCMKVTG